MVGHMTTALPFFAKEIAKLLVAMNQNVVKTETAATFSYVEREAVAQLHWLVYGHTKSAGFYEEHLAGTNIGTSTGSTQKKKMSEIMERVVREDLSPERSSPTSMTPGEDDRAAPLGLVTSGGTLCNLCALWAARNKRLGPTASFPGVGETGLVGALRFYGFVDVVILGSELMHYSLDKAADLLGIGGANLRKVPVSCGNKAPENFKER
eukprot:g13139.t1